MVKTEPVIFLVAEAYDSLAGNTPAGALFHSTTGASTLTAGEITMIDAETNSIATSASKRVRFAYYDKGTTQTVTSGVISVPDTLYVRKKAYQAPVKQVWTVEMTTGGSGITAGLSYILRVGRKSWTDVYDKEFAPKIYSVTIPAGTTTPQNYLATQFAAQINADPGRLCVATVSTDTITLTATEFDITFVPTIGQENWIDSAITNTVKWVRGSGSSLLVTAEEKKYQGYHGDVYREWNILRSTPPSIYTIDGNTYTCYLIHCSNRYAQNYNSHRAEVPVVHKVYIKSTAATIAAFEILIETVFGVTL